MHHDWIAWVTPRQPQELAAALLTLVADATRRRHHGAAAARFSRSFDWDTIADRHLAIYQSVLNPMASVGAEEG
ncbi:MAG: hypothetical protein HC881_22055 [Leptolyngbyaceae cyanobacterium SL_7_1]|nr:hypothetical protein [Leptolyngbyaceae cyanobacterium SL_7_1]